MKGDATGDAVVDKEEGVVVVAVRQASDQMDLGARHQQIEGNDGLEIH